MAKVYVARCIVKRNGETYKKGDIIEDLTTEEIKKGLAQKWLEAVGNYGSPAKEESGKPKEKPKAQEKPEEKSEENPEDNQDGEGTGEENNPGTGDENESGNGEGTGEGNGEGTGEGKTLDEMSKKELKAEARRLGVDFGSFDSEDEIRLKIKAAQGAGV